MKYFYKMNILIHRWIFPFMALLIACTVSCRKVKDEKFPVISVTQPGNGAIYSVGDTIEFEAVISDESHLNTIQVTLIDVDNKPVLPPIIGVPSSTTFIFKGQYIIDDFMLASGNYQLMFQADDGYNTSKKFIDIQLFSPSQKLLYPVIVTHQDSKDWKVWKLDSFTNGDGNWKQIFVQSGDYSGSIVNSATSQFYICGKSTSALTSLHLPDGAFQWQVKTQQNVISRYFEGMALRYPLLYISLFNGYISGIDKNGIQQYKTDTYSNTIPGKISITNSFVIGNFTDAFMNQHFLVAFYKQGGHLVLSRFIPDEVVDMFPIGNEEILIIGNTNGQGTISSFDAAENRFIRLYTFYEGEFRKAAAMDKYNFIVLSTTGIFHYKLNINSLTPFIESQGNECMTCNPVDQQVFIGSGKLLRIINFPLGPLQKSYTLPDTITDINLVFNK